MDPVRVPTALHLHEIRSQPFVSYARIKFVVGVANHHHKQPLQKKSDVRRPRRCNPSNDHWRKVVMRRRTKRSFILTFERERFKLVCWHPSYSAIQLSPCEQEQNANDNKVSSLAISHTSLSKNETREISLPCSPANSDNKTVPIKDIIFSVTPTILFDFVLSHPRQNPIQNATSLPVIG
jgi:hypothetical protein